MAWAAYQELEAVSRRTRAGLEARAQGKAFGAPRKADDGDQRDGQAEALGPESPDHRP